MLCVSTPFAPVFVRDHCPHATVMYVSAAAQFSFCLFLRPTLMQPVPIRAGQFLPHCLRISMWDCEPLTRYPKCWFFSLFQHSSPCHSIPKAVFSLLFSADKSIISKSEFAVRAVGISCWNQQPCSSASKKDMKFTVSSWWLSAVAFSLTQMRPIILHQETS